MQSPLSVMGIFGMQQTLKGNSVTVSCIILLVKKYCQATEREKKQHKANLSLVYCVFTASEWEVMEGMVLNACQFCSPSLEHFWYYRGNYCKCLQFLMDNWDISISSAVHSGQCVFSLNSWGRSMSVIPPNLYNIQLHWKKMRYLVVMRVTTCWSICWRLSKNDGENNFFKKSFLNIRPLTWSFSNPICEH